MAMDLGRRDGPVAAINVTPMADVVIVLLIILMVVTPQLKNDVDVPGARHGKTEEGRLVVKLTARGLRLGEMPVDVSTLEVLLRDKLERGSDTRVDLRADRALPYSAVAPVLEACRRAGAEEIAIVTQKEVGG